MRDLNTGEGRFGVETSSTSRLGSASKRLLVLELEGFHWSCEAMIGFMSTHVTYLGL